MPVVGWQEAEEGHEGGSPVGMLEVVAGSVRRAKERGKARARGLVLLATLPRPHRTVLEDGGAAQLNPLQAVQHLLPRQHKPGQK